MPAPHNRFKRALLSRQRQLGLWVALGNPISAELCAGAGFDWLLLDGEHGPNDLRSILHQLQAMSAYPSSPVVRIPVADATHIKQMLDIGAQTLLVPMVDTPDQATSMSRAMRYPPRGTRGIGAALARASGFNSIPDYLQTADAEVCLLVQAETRRSIEKLEAIAATEGVDGVFIGPSDLAADMGFTGRAEAAEVIEVVEDAIGRLVALGMPTGILAANPTIAQRYLEKGATFVAIGTDVGALRSGLANIRNAVES
ncbi:aldolase/citrate lyase family protein [Chelativorans sp. AA-79]|uniref:aldolase/citrate lyase family protein n=1 Tax=Chelativorans sp. AA-79 TaxID=3028735 RepID=UPI0023F92706|nr:aldolase/citrate lyase family protein [Chelativorans sp. AA-79]WEX12213.1 aldolase/citrate lyase family protein [Chelativorans sp. AA-79]